MPSKQQRLAKDSAPKAASRVVVDERDDLVVRFAGDAGDGVNLIGERFTASYTAQGNAAFTCFDAPAEIRAPAGTLAGVGAFHVHIGGTQALTQGDSLQILFALNPAALRAHLADLEPGGLLIVNSDAFLPEELEKAGYTTNPLTDGALVKFRAVGVPMNQLNREAIARVKVSPREAERCRNFFILGLALWLCDRPPEPTVKWIRETYARNPGMIEAGTRTLKAGWQCGEACAELSTRFRIRKVHVPAGRYRQVLGIDALALGVLAAAHQAGLPTVFTAFPAPPASDLLHRMCEWKQPNVKVIQAEDDLAALNLALGASFGGAVGVTATTGPGLALQTETLGLAVISELPCVVIAIQRAGPADGMPGKAEQADLWQALHGRNGESPLIVLAPRSSADGFATVREASRLALRYMTPVIVLTDTTLARNAETWRVPLLPDLPPFGVAHGVPPNRGAGSFLPYQRNERLARPWAVPGTPGLEHRTGGLEKEELTGNVSYDPQNHQRMVEQRARKIAGVADELPLLEVNGPPKGNLLVVGWGSTSGAICAAVKRGQEQGLSVASAHLRYLNPLPRNVGEVLRNYRRILVPELNTGQLCSLLRATFLVDAVSLSKVQGQPFLVREIDRKIQELLQ
ncbi:MAG: 2-oxoacid:acceptor oxidoreductase subunit alpha [Planctomycetes bacterium]|nr:2-oxoacid:acceptor oxidoreductase subunit alpha [Planctomycetota bacterium]